MWTISQSLKLTYTRAFTLSKIFNFAESQLLLFEDTHTMPNSPPTSLITIDLTSSLPSNVSLSTEGKGPYISLTDANPVLSGISSQFSSSQPAEGDCSVVISGASSLENHAVEEFRIMPLRKFIKVSDTACRYLCLTFLGTVVTLGLALTSISIAALSSDMLLEVAPEADAPGLKIETSSNRETPR